MSYDADLLFVAFWCSGMRKCNRKKAKSLFTNILKEQSDPFNFVIMLQNDIIKRLKANQLGFAQMHPTTYLNGERWEDEVIDDAENQLGRNSEGYRYELERKDFEQGLENYVAEAEGGPALDESIVATYEKDVSNPMG